MSFYTAFDRLIGNEGGYSNNPKDPGGETNWGISKRSYPALNIATLTREQAQEIYRRDFWERGQMNSLDEALAFQVFDTAVNHGIETAVRMLQQAAGVADDGHIGPVTLAAVRKEKPALLIMKFIATRIQFWTKLSTWQTFGRGWANRAAQDLLLAAGDLK